ncbi:hypothetical protein [Alicyclobacillus cycloheptanicus]|uniref:Uncharacterized protein n=1 Tax=Alicyclobacillus cycloheptanicus TaxID=1457 RepID=A0ABT9XEA7_9BACL|nr:hypothetical protein [Alicyclobacillus cycloheptanicus]MDQ0188617.1 hypothetical protein [Alicyclobacillus cycloheptanicus]
MKSLHSRVAADFHRESQMRHLVLAARRKYRMYRVIVAATMTAASFLVISIFAPAPARHNDIAADVRQKSSQLQGAMLPIHTDLVKLHGVTFKDVNRLAQKFHRNLTIRRV